MFNFENLHRNHKFAFLDGLLCGIVATVLAAAIYEDAVEDRNRARRSSKKTNVTS